MEFAVDWKIFATIFIAILTAASAALIVASTVGVLIGSFLSVYIDEKILSYIAGTGFIIIVTDTLYTA
mgnify:CR=1 FL=1